MEDQISTLSIIYIQQLCSLEEDWLTKLKCNGSTKTRVIRARVGLISTLLLDDQDIPKVNIICIGIGLLRYKLSAVVGLIVIPDREVGCSTTAVIACNSTPIIWAIEKLGTGSQQVLITVGSNASIKYSSCTSTRLMYTINGCKSSSDVISHICKSSDADTMRRQELIKHILTIAQTTEVKDLRNTVLRGSRSSSR